ncbi:MAG: hypothetical protein CVV52_16775 [Spirochaetae bacterium HGW-Spirochaetae-8]|nr:MAG: hypothetical protein CVV52_16775 [Spirochaetae bacterium HGW-Spirochaetae-8]
MTREEYHRNIAALREQAEKAGHLKEWMRFMCRNDIFFLGCYVLGRTDLDHLDKSDGTVQYRDWLFERCQEVQAEPDGYIDIWARDHYKSTIITWLKTIQDILVNPEITVCIYSYSSSLATKFLRQIKLTLESNKMLIDLFPDILFEDVSKPYWTDKKGTRHKMIWSEEGIRVKRKSSAKENTVEASGLVIGQRTGGHYNLLVYDDVVTPDSVTSEEMIAKTTKQFEMSLNTGSSGDLRVRIIGTRYHYKDTYSVIIEKGSAKLRMYPCEDGEGNPVLYDMVTIAKKRNDMGSAVFASQMMCNPKQASTMGFKPEWMKIWDNLGFNALNIYIFVDPAGRPSKKSDYTVMWVIGLGSDLNFYVLDLIRDKLDLTGKTNKLFQLVKRYSTRSKKPIVYYESVSMQADVEHMQYVMNQTNYRFAINPAHSQVAKGLRIESLEPMFRQGRIWFCKEAWHVNWEGRREDMMTSFINQEYLYYPFCAHDDGLDGLSWIGDPAISVELSFPDEITIEEQKRLIMEEKGIVFEDDIPGEYVPF